MSSTLYRKHRPQKFSQIVGQDHVTTTLSNALKRQQIAHAYLFAGARGLGKTTTARVLAKALNCANRKTDQAEPCNRCHNCQAISSSSFLDLIEIDGASNRGINEIRSLKEHIGFTPAAAAFRVFIIDEVHMLTTEAFNALLKTLEEPPAHALFILATTEVHKMPATIISRCQHFTFRKISAEEVIKRLKLLAKEEGVSLEPDVYRQLAKLSGGYLRDAESLLGQVIAIRPAKTNKISADLAALVLPKSNHEAINDFLEHISERDAAGAVGLVNRLTELGLDEQHFIIETVEELRHLLLGQLGVALSEARTNSKLFTPAASLKLIKLLLQAYEQTKTSQLPALPLEMAIVEFLASPSAPEIVKESSEKTSKPDRPTIVSDIPKAKPESVDKPGEVKLTEQNIKKHWPEVVMASREINHALPFILKLAKPLNFKNSTLELGFEYDFHLAKLADPNYKMLMTKAVRKVFVGDLKIVTRKLSEAELDDLRVKRAASDKADSAMVEQVLNVFGGEIID